MKSAATTLLALLAVSAACVDSAWGQTRPARRASPVGKVFVAETRGVAHVVTAERIVPLRQASAFDAPGAIFETRPAAHAAFVLSNGTGMVIDADTRMQIRRFDQENFRPSLAAVDDEPSLSQTAVFLERGFLGISTARIASGSTMIYSTAHGLANVRGRQVAIETNDENTIVYLLDGDVTVETTGTLDVESRVLRPGQQATIWPGPPPWIEVTEISPAKREFLSQRLGLASAARRTVSFETIARRSSGAPADLADAAGGEFAEEIVPRPTVAAEVPPHLVISPDRLPGT